MIAIVDYGAGNLGSIYKALRFIGTDVVVTRSADEIGRANALVLPGVGAFAHCMAGLREAEVMDATLDFVATGRPFLGICVGLQMLFDGSDEMGDTAGLGVLPGRVRRFDFGPPAAGCAPLKVPHMGWNALDVRQRAPLFEGVPSDAMVYFVHSYYADPADAQTASALTDYGGCFCSAVQVGNVFGTQFHPEKSGTVGLTILRNFTALSA